MERIEGIVWVNEGAWVKSLLMIHVIWIVGGVVVFQRL